MLAKRILIFGLTAALTVGGAACVNAAPRGGMAGQDGQTSSELPYEEASTDLPSSDKGERPEHPKGVGSGQNGAPEKRTRPEDMTDEEKAAMKEKIREKKEALDAALADLTAEENDSLDEDAKAALKEILADDSKGRDKIRAIRELNNDTINALLEEYLPTPPSKGHRPQKPGSNKRAGESASI